MGAFTVEALHEVERELERIGLLLEHDRELPSVTLIVAGEPIAGSWWGHPLGHAIYELAQRLHEGAGALDAKLVDGKVTYVHRRLWPAFLALARDTDPARRLGLSTLARELLQRVTEEGLQRLDALQRSGLATAKELAAASRELERRILVHADSLHTESGAHTKVLQTWTDWMRSRSEPMPESSLADARAEVAAALALLCQGTSRVPKTPWPFTRAR